MKPGDTVKVMSNPGGLFHGREGVIKLVSEKLGKVWVGLEFRDGGKGADFNLPWWFWPEELELVKEASFVSLANQSSE